MKYRERSISFRFSCGSKWIPSLPWLGRIFHQYPSSTFLFLPKPVFVIFLSLTTKGGSIKKLQFIILAPSSRQSLDLTFWSLCLTAHRPPSLGPFHLLCPSFTPLTVCELSPRSRHPLHPLGSAYNLRKTSECYPEETHTAPFLRGTQSVGQV